ncbi:acetyltransferase [Cytophagales bacterium WSM2-2]|nr:acetyltransferase [Cytophagales bacterium WSM2-2]
MNYTSRDGRQITIRRPTENDAEGIINYSKKLFASTDQVLTTLDEYTITVEAEVDWINNFNSNPNSRLLIAEHNSEIVGLLFFATNVKKKNMHVGEFGVSVHPDYQGIGIGRALVESLLVWARENKRIEKVFLNVFHTNKNAIKLYERLGFIEEGRHVKAIKQPTGEYVDVLQMYVETK